MLRVRTPSAIIKIGQYVLLDSILTSGGWARPTLVVDVMASSIRTQRLLPDGKPDNDLYQPRLHRKTSVVLIADDYAEAVEAHYESVKLRERHSAELKEMKDRHTADFVALIARIAPPF